MASLFDTLQAGAQRAGVTARTKDSQKWFQKKAQELVMPNRKALLKDDALEQVEIFVVICICIFMILNLKKHYHITIDFH